MNKVLNSKFILLVLFCWSFSGCANFTMSARTPTSLSTVPVNVPTVTLTPQSAYKVTLTPFQLVLPAITRSPLELENDLLKLLKTNGDCNGKCIAGVRPDEMAVQEAANVMSQWGSIRVNNNNKGEIYISLVQVAMKEYLTVNLFARTFVNQPEKIDGIQIRIDAASERYVSEDLWLTNQEPWKAFHLDSLLRAYGIPSYVGYFFQTTVSPGSSLKGRMISYLADIHFKDIDLVIEVMAIAYYDGNNVLLCLDKDPHNLVIEINPERPLVERQEFYPVTWQSLTSTDLEAFYRKFTDETNPDACIATNLEQIQLLQPSFR